MKIIRLKLLTHKLQEEKEFYSQILGFELIEESLHHFTVQVGWSELTFEKSVTSHTYHYCFLIPSNKLNEALEWMKNRVEIVEDQEMNQIQLFESWNAESFYFFDKSGNLAEFIVRNDLDNKLDEGFNISQVLCLSEIGVPVKDIARTSQYLNQQMGVEIWKGDVERFAVVGDQDGLLLLPNYEVKKSWFPTEIKVKPEPIEALIEIGKNRFQLAYNKEAFEIFKL